MSSTFSLKIPADIARTTLTAIRSLPGSKYNEETKCWVLRSVDIDVVANYLRDTHPLLAELLNTSPRFEKSRQYMEKLLDSFELSHATSADIDLYQPPGLALYPFQKAGVLFGMDKSRGGVLIADQMGCVSGKTMVSLQRNKTTNIVSVSKLYTMFHNLQNSGSDPTFHIRCLKDDHFGPWPMRDIIYTGVKDVIRLRTKSGKFLVATSDHKIRVKEGWAELGQLKVGDTIIVNGAGVCVKCGQKKTDIITYSHAKYKGYCRSCMYAQRDWDNMQEGKEIIMVPMEDEVLSLQSGGKTDVYDIVMEDPYRNFIANGIVVHNCGKTPQALSIINNLGIKTALIVCPNIAKINWWREAKKWLDRHEWINLITAENKYSIGEAGEGVISIINYNILPKYVDRLAKIKYECIIADEAHFIKNERTDRAKAVYKISKHIPKKIALTGTPMSNGRPIDLWGIIHWLDPKTWIRKLDFELRYCNAHRGYWGWENTGASNLEELQTILRSTLMIRRLKKDVLNELPPKQRTVIEIPADKRSAFIVALREEDKYKGEVERMLAKAKAAPSPNDYLSIMKELSSQMDKLSKSRKELALAKMPEVISFVQTIVDEGEKVIVFAHHREVTEGIYKHFKPYSRIAIGGDDPKTRQQGIDDFQKDPEVKVWVGSFLAAGTAINLTAAHTIVMAELMYDPASMDQAEDRGHRIGQTNAVQIYYMVLEKSIDSRIAELLVSKMDMITEALDDRSALEKY
jgi:SWI/SNF-related matrix-associated actin-dependent regulator 1 of chromatin subfamily A